MARYSDRIPVEYEAAISVDGIRGHGRVVNLSVPGCLLETRLRLTVGQSLHCQLISPTGSLLTVPLAMVRWVKDSQAGVEFIRMSQEDQAYLRCLVGSSRHVSPQPVASEWCSRTM